MILKILEQNVWIFLMKKAQFKKSLLNFRRSKKNTIRKNVKLMLVYKKLKRNKETFSVKKCKN